jgi:hypothetical protein
MNKAEIKATILKAMGNPESGVIKDNVDAMADALHKELNGVEESSFKVEKETRVTKVSETR